MNKKLWISLFAVLSVFAAVLIGMELVSERNYKKSILSSKLEGFTSVIAESNNSESTDYESITRLLPDSIRVSVISTDGEILYDSYRKDGKFDNHLNRPEIADCLNYGHGSYIRYSETSGLEYLYYAKRYKDIIVRCALPFELNHQLFLLPDRVILISIGILFTIMLLIVYGIAKRINKEADHITKEKLQKQKRQMTNNIAHELRTPVTSIRGYLETITANPQMADDKKNLFIERAYRQTIRLSDLIRDISLITKIEEAPEKLEKQYLGIRKIVDEILDEFDNQIKANNVKVENKIPELMSITGNQSLIYAIFKNLIENSLRHGGENITIRLEGSTQADGFAHFIYSDNGKGVAPKHLERIFERFYRIFDTDNKNKEGSGLGLSIVRNAVAFHNGKISAVSNNGCGLRFDFTLKID